MSLKKCSKCGNEIYIHADPCPKCGYSPSYENSNKLREKIAGANNKIRIALDNQFPNSIKCKICGSRIIINSPSDISDAKYCGNCGYNENYIYCYRCSNLAFSIDPFENIFVCGNHFPTVCIGCGTIVSGDDKYYQSPTGGCNARSGYGPFCGTCCKAYDKELYRCLTRKRGFWGRFFD